MQSKIELQEQIEKFAITPPTEEELKEYFEKTLTFLKDVIPNEKFDKFVDKQLEKLNDDKVNAYDVLLVLIKAVFAKA